MNTEPFQCINTPSLRKDRLSSTVKIYPSPRSHPRLYPGSVQNPYRSPHFDTDRIRSSKQYKFIFETSVASRKACDRRRPARRYTKSFRKRRRKFRISARRRRSTKLRTVYGYLYESSLESSGLCNHTLIFLEIGDWNLCGKSTKKKWSTFFKKRNRVQTVWTNRFSILKLFFYENIATVRANEASTAVDLTKN